MTTLDWKRRGMIWGMGVIFAACVLAFVPAAQAQNGLSWHPSLESARVEAAKTNRLIFVHFWANWCSACKKAEAEILTRPEIVNILSEGYVLVKINSDLYPDLIRTHRIALLPSDLLLTADGREIDRMVGVSSPGDLAARLLNASANARRAAPPASVSAPVHPVSTASPSPESQNKETPQAQETTVERPILPPASQPEVLDDPPQKGQVATNPLRQPETPIAAPAAPPVAPQPQGMVTVTTSTGRKVQIPAGSPPLGLDGFCPVQLAESRRWVPGDPRFGVIHRGRTYLFAGLAEQKRFLDEEKADTFAPMLGGLDVVVAVEQKQEVSGDLRYGGTYGNRTYLFASESNLLKFVRNPDYYVKAMYAAFSSDAPKVSQNRRLDEKTCAAARPTAAASSY